MAKKLAFSCVTVLLLFGLLEAGLRVTGIAARPVLGTLRFGYTTGIPRFDSDGIEYEGRVFADYPLFQADAALFWKPIADTAFTGRDGFRLPVPSGQRKRAGVYRVAVLGDSCSFLGHRLYPERFAELAAQQMGQPVEVVNASCPGYSSFQGSLRADDLWPWEPDLLVVYFGWNDHWNALHGYTDAELGSPGVVRPAYGLCQRLHAYWALVRVLRRDATAHPSRSRRTVRVPLGDYRRNLHQLSATAAEHDCRVVFVTAPTGLVAESLPEWVYAFFGRFYEMSIDEIRAIPRTHDEYNRVVRQVARESGDLLLDLAESWPSGPSSGRFRNDCIHLTEQGHADAALALWELWKEQNGL